MKSFSYSIEQLAKFCGAQFKGANANAHISQLIIDSRKAKDFSTHLFIAIKGSRHDGHNFIKDLYESCLLYTSPSPRDPKTSRMPSSA